MNHLLRYFNNEKIETFFFKLKKFNLLYEYFNFLNLFYNLIYYNVIVNNGKKF